jgi:hypothetical protein
MLFKDNVEAEMLAKSQRWIHKQSTLLQ